MKNLVLKKIDNALSDILVFIIIFASIAKIYEIFNYIGLILSAIIICLCIFKNINKLDNKTDIETIKTKIDDLYKEFKNISKIQINILDSLNNIIKKKSQKNKISKKENKLILFLDKSFDNKYIFNIPNHILKYKVKIISVKSNKNNTIDNDIFNYYKTHKWENNNCPSVILSESNSIFSHLIPDLSRLIMAPKYSSIKDISKTANIENTNSDILVEEIIKCIEDNF